MKFCPKKFANGKIVPALCSNRKHTYSSFSINNAPARHYHHTNLFLADTAFFQQKPHFSHGNLHRQIPAIPLADISDIPHSFLNAALHIGNITADKIVPYSYNNRVTE